MKIIITILLFSISLIATPNNLTQEEREWIKNNEVTIGISELYPLMYTDKENKIDGFIVNILEVIINKYNLKTKIIKIDQAAIPLAIKEDKIDLAPLINNEKIENTLGFYSSEVLQIKRVLFVKKENKSIQSIDDLQNKKVAMVNQLGTIPHIKKEYEDIKIARTNNIEESVQKLLIGEVDALLASPIIIQKYLEDNLIIDLKAIPEISFKPSKLYFFTSQKQKILQSILEKGLNSISIREEKEIFDKWFLKDLASLPIIFTKEEIKYLDRKPRINLCVDPDWMPYEKIENDKHIGIVADYMTSFQEKIGVPLHLVETKNWTESLQYIENRNCDILSLLLNTKDRQDYMNFTKPYIVFSLVLVTKRDVTFVSDLKELEDKKIGIQKDFAYNEMIRQNYKNLEIVDVEHLRSGLEKVERGELFGQVATHLSVAYAFQEEFYGSLQVSGKFDEKLELSVGIRNDDLILLNIFNKVVNHTTKETRQKIISKWISVDAEKKADYTIFWNIIIFLSSVLLLILYTYLAQYRYIKKLKKAKKEIEVFNTTLEDKVQLRTQELEQSNKKLKVKTSELENLNNNLDAKIKKEIDNRKKQERFLIQQSKLAEMGEMISMIAHQWRQPLSALGTIIQNIHLRYSLGKLDQEYLEKQRVLSNALTEKMSTTIDDFRNFFKPNKEKKDFSVKSIIEQTIFLIDDSFKSHNIKIDNAMLDDYIVYGFENELYQVLLNILMNSKDAFVENNTHNSLIQIKTKKIQTHIKILIMDNAGGISKSVIDRIFEPYFTTKDTHNGTGLGLYMSKIIIEENMQGELKVENIDNGVAFSIYIPIH